MLNIYIIPYIYRERERDTPSILFSVIFILFLNLYYKLPIHYRWPTVWPPLATANVYPMPRSQCTRPLVTTHHMAATTTRITEQQACSSLAWSYPRGVEAYFTTFCFLSLGGQHSGSKRILDLAASFSQIFSPV